MSQRFHWCEKVTGSQNSLRIALIDYFWVCSRQKKENLLQRIGCARGILQVFKYPDCMRSLFSFCFFKIFFWPVMWVLRQRRKLLLYYCPFPKKRGIERLSREVSSDFKQFRALMTAVLNVELLTVAAVRAKQFSNFWHSSTIRQWKILVHERALLTNSAALQWRSLNPSAVWRRIPCFWFHDPINVAIPIQRSSHH